MSQLRMPFTGLVATLLATVCLGAAFEKASWFMPTAVAALVVVAGCEAARRLRVPAPLALVVGYAALFLYVTARYAGDAAMLHVLPDRDAVRVLEHLAAEGGADIDRYAAPILPSRGVELLTVLGVGLVAGLVDAFAVGLRRAALAGLPLLALYTVPATVAPHGVPIPAFVLGAAGYLALLLAESRERVGRWGRSMRYSSHRADWAPPADTSPLAATGRRVGAAVLGIAVVVPILVPGIDQGLLGGAGSGIGGRGGGGNRDISYINPIVDLGSDLRRGKNRVVLKYTGKPTYLRMVALDDFNGTTWAPEPFRPRPGQQVKDGLPNPPGLDSLDRTTRRYRIEIVDLEEQWLPLPYPAEKVDIGGTWLYDSTTFNVFSPDTSTQDRNYTATVRAVDLSPEELKAATDAPPSLVDRDTDLPADLPPSVADLAVQVTKGAKTDYDKAVALQAWFRNPEEFTYSTNAPDGNGSSAIANFLQRRTGYCVHFASAMAVMARTLHIPARVAVGFTEGERVDGKQVVRLHDAHAWPELYFEGVGWVAFEPTPATRTGAPPAYTNAPIGPVTGPDGGPGTPTDSATDPASSAKQRQLGERENDQRRNPNPAALPQVDQPFPWLPVSLGAALLVLLVAPGLTRLVVRRRRFRRLDSPEAAAAAAWAELEDLLEDYGYAWREADTPRRGMARLVEDIGLYGDAEDALHRLVRVIERVRYSPRPGEVVDLRRELREVAAGMRAAARPWDRFRARFMPRSTRRVFGVVADRFADVLDAVDRGLAALRLRLLPGRAR